MSCFLQTLLSWNVSQNQGIVDTHSRQLQFADRSMKLPRSVTLNEAAAHVTLHLQPNSEIEVMAKVQEPLPATGTWIVEGAVTTQLLVCPSG